MSTRDVSHSAESGQDRLNPLESIFEFHADPLRRAPETGACIGRFCHERPLTGCFLRLTRQQQHSAAGWPDVFAVSSG